MREKFVILLQEFDQTEVLDTKNNIERIKRIRSLNMKRGVQAYIGGAGNLAGSFKRPSLRAR